MGFHPNFARSRKKQINVNVAQNIVPIAGVARLFANIIFNCFERFKMKCCNQPLQPS